MSDAVAQLRARVRPDIRAMRGYVPGEQRNRAVKLNTNESPWGPAPGVHRALAELDADALRQYPDPACTALRAAAGRRYGLDPASILVGNGSDDCLTIIYRSLLRPGDRVAVPHPTYGLYDQLAAIQGADLVHLPWANGWALPDLSATDARLVLLANPNNPSGTVVPRAQLCALARSLDGILVVDEAYIDFADEPAGMLPLLAELPNLIVLRTFSKSFGLAAARLGLLFAHPALVCEFAKVKDSYNVGVAPQAMGLAALADPEHHAATVERIRTGRRELERFCAERAWELPPTQANFVLCRLGAQAGATMRALRERDILVRWFDTPELRSYLRISVGTPEQQAALFAALADCGP